MIASIYKFSELFDVGYCRMREGPFEAAIDAGFLYWISVDEHPDRERYPAWIAALRRGIETGDDLGGWLPDPTGPDLPTEENSKAACALQPPYALLELNSEYGPNIRSGLYTEPGWRLWNRLVETRRLTGSDATLPATLPPLQVVEAVMREAFEQKDWYTVKVWFVMAFGYCVMHEDIQALSEMGPDSEIGLIRKLGVHREACTVTERYDITDGLIPDDETAIAYETEFPGFAKFAEWWFGPWRKFSLES